jgi:hypothetical protein
MPGTGSSSTNGDTKDDDYDGNLGEFGGGN